MDLDFGEMGIAKAEYRLTAEGKGRDRKDVEAQILKFCRDNMAPYKVPKKIYFHDALPLTAVGKLDLRSVDPPDSTPHPLRSEGAMPPTALRSEGAMPPTPGPSRVSGAWPPLYRGPGGSLL